MGQPSGGGGGYNPQMMPGQGGDNGGSIENGATGGMNNVGGTPFWQPWEGWNMKLGTDPTAAGNDAQAQASVPGSTPGLYSQMAKFFNQPMYTNPNQYGRYNWGLNLGGQGPSSPFGQYAQQQSRYSPLGLGQMGLPGGPGGPTGASQPQAVGTPGGPGFSWLQGNSSAAGAPSLDGGHISNYGAFGGRDTAAGHQATNIYAGQYGINQMTPEQLQNSALFTKQKTNALASIFGSAPDTRNHMGGAKLRPGVVPTATPTAPTAPVDLLRTGGSTADIVNKRKGR